MAESTKICRKCAQVKLHDAFNRKSASPDGLQPACRACVSMYNRELYLRDPATARAKNDAWNAANPDRVRELARLRSARNWVERNEQMRVYQRTWYSRNLEK